jgi:uncharacterized protein YjaG (DUF416 family)
MDETKKSIDETWKETAKKERPFETLKEDAAVPPEPDFNFFITTLAIQASISLGAMPNPATNKTEQNVPQAKFIIDTLGMLKEKTKGNLTSEEDKMLENILYELRTHYLSLPKEATTYGTPPKVA